MGTEIKNTLFRFVTMRAPELPQPEDADLGFISFPKNSAGDSNFLSNLETADRPRKEFLRNVVRNYVGTELSTLAHVQEHVGSGIYNFAQWLTANRTKFTLEELEQQLPANYIEPEDTVRLWDNLFYQIITSKSPYVRDMILSVLVANSLLQKNSRQKLTIETARKAALARVIVPKELVGIDVDKAAPEKVKRYLDSLPVSTKHIDAHANAGIAVARIAELENIKAELEKAKQLYDKQNGLELENARQVHDAKIKYLYDNASFQEKTYIDPHTKVEVKYKEFDKFELPPFLFTPEDELTARTVTDSVSEETNEYIADQITARGVLSLTAMIDQATADIQGHYQAAAANTFTLSNNAGGGGGGSTGSGISNGSGGSGPNVIAPVTGPSNPGGPTAPTNAAGVFNINSTSLNSSGTTALLVVIDNVPEGIDITTGNYTITFNDSTSVTKTSDFNDSWSNGKLHLWLFTSKVSIANKTSFTLNGQFEDTTGGAMSFTGSGKIESHNAAWQATRYVAKGNGRATYVREAIVDDNGTEVLDAEVIAEYVPSGFGIKRLGIADYRKVEQEVCCYVPGEVSHIENIMAREYREKSTRRLSRSETTTTTSTEHEREKLTDTSTTDRFEMNRETASLLAEDKAIGAHASFNAQWGAGDTKYGMNAGADFAYNTSKEESETQAINMAKEITARALDRVVQKVKEERIIKVIEEFEENNKHGFDNRDGDRHISGVYRWVDKIYNNKIVNYGKRLMYEFMIPEPAAFHVKAIASQGLVPPVDPRIGNGLLKLESADKIKPENYLYWAGQYGADVEAPAYYLEFTDALSKVWNNDGESSGRFANAIEKIIEIPEGYKVISHTGSCTFYHAGNTISQISEATYNNHNGRVTIGSQIYYFWKNSESQISLTNPSALNIEKTLSVAVASWDLGSFALNLQLKCEKTEDAKKQWQLETFNAIIDAYQLKLRQYEQKLAELKAENEDKNRVNPLFYRDIENTSLRKSCIAYLASHAKMGGEDMMLNRTSMNIIQNYSSPKLESYSALVKFMEQAFEWDIISYNFYPFYWAEKGLWKDLYSINNDDPLFRSFLQSGMARVIVTVSPGFEEAVNWYMGTGQVWNGGQVPTLNDELFISIVDELKNPESVVEETWESRVPTSLTVIQAGNIGLMAEGLPCNPECNDYLVTDENGEVKNTNPISQNEAQIGVRPPSETPGEGEPAA